MSIDALDVAFFSVFVTLVSVGVGFLSGYADRRHARRLAHDEWLSVRRGDTYVDLLDYTYRMVAHVDHYSASQGKVAPSNDEARRMSARLTAYGSREVEAAAMDVINGCLAMYGAETGPGQTDESGTTFRTMPFSREEIIERQRALEALVSAELTSLPGARR